METLMTCEAELIVALEAVTAASRLCVAVRNRPENITAVTKTDQSPVTAADFGSQAVMSLTLMKAFGNEKIVAEEETSLLRTHPALLERVHGLVEGVSGRLPQAKLLDAIDRGNAAPPSTGRFWTMDPIDGTKGFLRKDQFAVALALIENGKVILGVLGCPGYRIGSEFPEGAIFFAVSGAGAYQRSLGGGSDARLKPAESKDGLPLKFCESLEPAHAAHGIHRRIADILGITGPPLRLDSQAKYGAIARGDADLYLRLPRDPGYREKIWDHAAGSLLVEEAGGRVTDFDGNPLNFSAGRHLGNRSGLLACNRRIHEPALLAVREATSHPPPIG